MVVFFFPVGLSLLSQHSQQFFWVLKFVVITTKGLQEGKTTVEWDDGGKICNKNKLILTQTSHRCMKHDLKLSTIS